MLTTYWKNILSHLKHNIWWCGKIFYHMSWMIFFMNIHNKFCFAKKLHKKVYKNLMLVYYEQFIAWNAQVILEPMFQIPLLPSIFQLCSIQTIYILRLNQIWWHINLLTHQEICPNSNTTYPPQKGMWPLRIETNIKHPMTPYHFKLFFIFICFLNPLTTCTLKLHFVSRYY
jgi:hypothetical protein